MMALDQRALGKYAEPIVYVVDDDISVRESLELLIRQAGWVPLMFDSAHAFLSHPRADAPHCLVLDLTLPDINGLDVQNEVYRDQRFMPIIFITGQGDIPTSVQAMKAGAFEFLTKPFFHDELLLSIKHAIERSRAVLRDEAELNVIPARSHHANVRFWISFPPAI
jgi:FixJ family two-component response regulator